jgi:hypothetical protein
MNILFQPYPVDFSLAQRWKTVSLFSLFVFLFLYVFQPFDLNTYDGNLFFITLGYGLTCFVVMLITNIVIPATSPAFFEEDNWTTFKELLFTFLNICIISIANVFYSVFIGIMPMNLQVFVLFLFYTIAIGVFPISIFILIRQVNLKQKFEANSLAMNEILSTELKKNSSPSLPKEQKEQITISSYNLSEELTINSNDLLYIQSADNYIVIYYFKNQTLSRFLIRNTLKQVEQDLEKYPQIFRCHKSYLVNTQKISSFSGNAQGYKLHFLETDVKIPVSRKLNKKVHQLIAT